MSKSPNKTGGPVVKSGPTRGKNRSRNDDGRWRKKRSDTGKSRGKKGQKEKSGCFLTTAACEYKGLPDDCFELKTMREFRDEVMLADSRGRSLVSSYYERAPKLVPLLEDPYVAEEVWKKIQSIVQMIVVEDGDKAIETYRDMVEGLEAKVR